jgi:S-adenosylmethionine:tRNA ribosyltransferase-isomerase
MMSARHTTHSGDSRPELTTDDFDYALPPELIASRPSKERSASRLLRLTGAGLGCQIEDHAFADLARFVSAGDVMVFNDTRVIKARLYGEKESGGRIEIMVERLLGDNRVLAQIRASKSPRAGARLTLEGALRAEVLGRQDDLYELRFEDRPDAGGQDLLAALDRHGRLPLPPYIDRPADAEDEARYQTVYARAPGAVAAPTAGLHFDEAMLGRLRERGVILAWLTLHVGAGTFQPVRSRLISEHRMHAERFVVPEATAQAIAAARRGGRRVIAVGTTSLRALEAAARASALCGGPDADDGLPPAGEGETRIFITPGFRFRVVDRLITNFHLPRSTLLMLVSAFAGMEPVRAAYRHAIANRYRFFSYGDAMLMDRAEQGP